MTKSHHPEHHHYRAPWENSFSIQEAFGKAWDVFVADWRLFLVIQVCTSLILFLAAFFADKVLEGTFTRLLADVLKLGLQIIIGLGLMFVYLRVYDGIETEPLDMFDPLPLFWGYAGVMILYILGVGIGLVLLVIPGIVLASGWSLAHYIMIETNKNPVDALKESWALTEGHKLNISLFAVICFALNFVGMLAFGLGLLITLPLTGLAYAHVYRYFIPKTETL